MENRTGDPTQTYLAAGLAEDIARRLETEVIRRGAPVDLNGVQSRMLSADGDVRSACSLRRHGEEAPRTLVTATRRRPVLESISESRASDRGAPDVRTTVP